MVVPPAAARLWLSATVLAILMTASGCANDADRGATDDDSRAPSSADPTASGGPSPDHGDSSEATESAVDPKARKALRSAFLGLVRENTGRFEVTIPFGSDYSIYEQGEYQIRPVAYDAVRVLTTPDGTLRMAQRAVGDEIWVRLESVTREDGDTPGWPCWVNYDDIAKLEEFPAGLGQYAVGQPPAAIVVASYGIGKQATTAGSIDGTTDLALVLSLLGGRAVLASGIDPQGDDTVPATFSLDERTLSGFTVPLAQLPDAIDAAGGELPAEVDELSEMPGAIAARFFDFGVSVDVAPLPAEEVLEFRGAEDYEAAMRACGG